MYVFLIVVHAVAATAALILGVLCWRRRSWLPAYEVTLALSVAVVAGAVALDWSALPVTARAFFVALVVFGVVLVSVVHRVRRMRGDHRFGLGFTIISLTDGFVVIAVLDLGAPLVAVIGSGVAVAVIGHLVLRRLTATPVAPRSRPERLRVTS